MSEEVVIVSVVFSSIVLIVFLGLAFSLVSRVVDRRKATNVVVGADQANYDVDLQRRAERMRQRIQNLEEILLPRGADDGGHR